MITPMRPSDFRLLQRYALEQDEAAFEELVQRHGGMTRGVCHRVLGAGGDADDAAQSAFLSLAKNAPLLVEQLGPSGSLGGWLYRVAVNAALQQRRATKARKNREIAVVRERDHNAGSAATVVEQSELLIVLDEEMRDLPARYRTPLVLCHLEGKTQHEAASELGLSYGTLRRRLDQGRQLLKARIGRRGVMASSAFLVMFWKSAAAEASSLPLAFVESVTSALKRNSGTIPQPVAVVRPRVASPARVPGPGAKAAGSLSTSFYASTLALLLLAMAVPPVISAIESEANASSSAQTDSPAMRSPVSPTTNSLSRSAV